MSSTPTNEKVLERKVLPQDRPQFEQSVYPTRLAKYTREKKEYDTALQQYETETAQYEKDLAQYEKDQAAAEKQYQKELAAFKSKFQSDYGISYDNYLASEDSYQKEIDKYNSEIKKIQAEKEKALSDYHATANVEGQRIIPLAQQKVTIANIGKSAGEKIETIENKIKTASNIRSLNLSNYPQWVKEKVKREWNPITYGTISAVSLAEKYYTSKTAQSESQRLSSIQTAQATAQQLQSKYAIDLGAYAQSPTPFTLTLPTKEFSERADQIKPTPLSKSGLTAKLPAPEHRINVITGNYIYGDYFLEKDVRAEYAALAKRNVTAAGKPIPNVIIPEKPAFSFQGGIVREPSAVALLEFQSQLKTRTAPAPSIYLGILEQKGLSLTPTSQKIIDVYSSKSLEEKSQPMKVARGRKPVYTDPLTGESFDTETLQGSQNIAKQLGYKIVEPETIYEFQGEKITDPSAITLLKFQSQVKTPTRLPSSIYEGLLAEKGLAKTPKATEIITAFSEQPATEITIAKGRLPTITDKKTGEIFDLQTGYGSPKIAKAFGLEVDQKPLSSTGERLEYYMREIEKAQRSIGTKRGDEATLVQYALEFPKDLLAGAAFVENKLWEGEALIGGYDKKTRDIQIPPTAFGVVTDTLFTTKSPVAAKVSLTQYTQKYGKGSLLGSVSALAVPLPSFGKISVPAKIAEPFQKVSSKIGIPQAKNTIARFNERIKFGPRSRLVEQYAESRSGEGLFGITKLGKDTYKIERGLEETRPDLFTKPDAPKIIGFTKYEKGQVPKPIYAKSVSTVIPSKGGPAITPITVVRFVGKGKAEITDFTDPSAVRIPPTAPSIIGFTKVKPKSPLTPIFTKPERVIISSADPDFGRTAKTLRLEKTDTNIYEKSLPTKYTMRKLAQAEETGQINLLAVGRTVPYELARIKEPRFSFRKPKESIFDYIGPKARVTRIYETAGFGLGKGKGFIARTKQPDFISVGSRDFDKIMERVGLTPKRPFKAASKFDVEPFGVELGGAGGYGRAKALTESTKQLITNVSGERQKPVTDYLKSPSLYVPPKNIEQTKFSTPYEIEFETVRYPDVQQWNRPLVIPKVRPETKSVWSVRAESAEKLDTSLVTRQKTQTIQQQKLRLDVGMKTRGEPIQQKPAKLRSLTFTIPRLKAPTLERFKLVQPQRTKQQEVQLLKPLRITPPKSTRTRTVRKGGVALWKQEPFSASSEKKDDGKKFLYLGNVPEGQVEGIFGRQETTYGKSKIEKLRKGDVRIVTGRKRSTPKKKSKWYEGKQGDMFGFKSEAKKITKKSKSKDVSFW